MRSLGLIADLIFLVNDLCHEVNCVQVIKLLGIDFL